MVAANRVTTSWLTSSWFRICLIRYRSRRAGTLSDPITDRVVSSTLHEAILKFQKINHLSVDGHVDPHESTVGLLIRLASPLPVPTVAAMSALAEKDKGTSLQWALRVVARLSEARQFLVSPTLLPPTSLGLTLQALEVHFHISTSTIPREDYISKVIENYLKAIHVLNNSAIFFIDDTTSIPAKEGRNRFWLRCRALETTE